MQLDRDSGQMKILRPIIVRRFVCILYLINTLLTRSRTSSEPNYETNNDCFRSDGSLFVFRKELYGQTRAVGAHSTRLPKREWPKFALPESKRQITVADVLNEPAGQERDAMIREWCASVWQAYRDSHTKVRDPFADSLHS
jgi:hypothetical protein